MKTMAVQLVTVFFLTSFFISPNFAFNISAAAPGANDTCRGQQYEGFYEDRAYFNSVYNYIEAPISLLSLILTSLIASISIFGKIDGTFKWFILNIAILHLLWPLVSKIIVLTVIRLLVPKPWTNLTSLIVNAILNIGTVDLTTAICGSLPLALNRFLLMRQNRLYNILFGSKINLVFFILVYDSILFSFFYTFYILAFINAISSGVYYIAAITIMLVTNFTGLGLMLYLIYDIKSSIAMSKNLQQKRQSKERRRIAIVIVIQIIINFGLVCFRVFGFVDFSNYVGQKPQMMCMNIFWNWFESFFYSGQESLVCLDCIIYLFVLTLYREQLVAFWRMLTGKGGSVKVWNSKGTIRTVTAATTSTSRLGTVSR